MPFVWFLCSMASIVGFVLFGGCTLMLFDHGRRGQAGIALAITILCMFTAAVFLDLMDHAWQVEFDRTYGTAR